MTSTHKDPGGVLKDVHDEAAQRLRVDIGGTAIAIDSLDDSIAIGDTSGNKVTTKTIGTDVGLDVNIIGTTGLSTALKASALTITSTAQKVPNTALAGRNSLSVRVWGTNTVYFGDSTVTTSSGYPKLQNEEMVLDIKDNPSIDLWAVCAGGQTCEIRIIELA